MEVLGFLVLLPLFVMAVVVHEVSHGWVALRLGDTTALSAGRLTLNPFRHIDPVGTVLLPLALLLFRAPFLFGWAKPVPVNAMNMRHPRRDMLWVGAAGPAANFSLALVAALFLKGLGSLAPALVVVLGKYLVVMNLVLGTFNLLPIPPLDGSRVLTGLLPLPLAKRMFALERWGFLIVMALLYLGVLNRILWPVVEFLAKALGV